jgi:alpha-beta hydrolase superfamily lysophospholipase
MIMNILTSMMDFFHAQLCYQLFITPLPLPLEKEYRDFAERACEFMTHNRTQVINHSLPKPHVIHHFAQKNNPSAKKVLITHGWMSRAAYMVRLIRVLHKQGYEIYALDFPAHGEAKGMQLTWYDSVTILRDTLNRLGPFYAVVGHSFGGSMLLNTLNLSSQLPEWSIDCLPERAVLIASPTNMRTPVRQLARRFKLSAQGLLLLRNVFRQQAYPNINHLNIRHFIKRGTTPILCIHGKNDSTIDPRESIRFCRRYPHASLALLPNIDHVGVLIDPKVENIVCNYLQ